MATSNGATVQGQSGPAKSTTPQSSKPSNGEKADTKSPAKKRRKVNHACIYCRRSHMTCDLERPCTRCIKRNIGHLCHDEPREPAKKGKAEGATIPVQEDTPMPDTEQHGSIPRTMSLAQLPHNQVTSNAPLVQPTPVPAPHRASLTPNSKRAKLRKAGTR